MGKTCLKDIIKVSKELKADYTNNIEKEKNKELYVDITGILNNTLF